MAALLAASALGAPLPLAVQVRLVGLAEMKLKGYASTHLPVPIKVQNLVIRDYCARHGHEYFMSDVEFVSGWHVLQGIHLPDFDGICAYSMACIPSPLTWSLYGKEIHLALENYVLPRDWEIFETIRRLKLALATT